MERWVWQAIYTDHTILDQYDEQGVFHQIREIEQDRLLLMVLRKVDRITGYAIDSKQRLTIPWQPGMRFIHFHNQYFLNVGNPDDNVIRKVRVCGFGYQRLVDGKNEKSVMYVDPHDNIYLSDTDSISL